MLKDEYDYKNKRKNSLEKEFIEAVKSFDKSDINNSEETNDWWVTILNIDINNYEYQRKNLLEELNNVCIVSPTIQKEIIWIGSKVSILVSDNFWEQEESFVIWGYNTPIKGRYSYNAPIINPIIWLRVWDEVEVFINDTRKVIEILDIDLWIENK